MDYSKLVFIDTETTGLDPRFHEVWEVGMIVWEDNRWLEHRWFLPLQKPLGDAEPIALEIGHFFERYPVDENRLTSHQEFVEQFSALTWNKHLVGAIPSFDEERIRHIMWWKGYPFKWHYHLLDIEAMIVGWLQRDTFDSEGAQTARYEPELLELPWKHRDLVKALGVDWPKEGEHTALGDARLVRDCFVQMFGEPT